MQKIIHKISDNYLNYFLLLLIAFFVYGYQIHRLGFYWDDWMSLLISNIETKNAFWDYYRFDRPFSVWTFYLTFPILKNNPILWQLFTISIRGFGGIGIYLIIKKLWPDHNSFAFWSGALWLVFPGFQQQSISVAYSQHFLTYLLFLYSLFFFVLSIHEVKYRWVYLLVSVLLSIVSMFSMEYFIGLELLRPVVVFILLRNKHMSLVKIVKKIIRYWSGYFFIYGGFLYYRFFWLKALIGGEPANPPVLLTEIINNPLQGLILLVQNIVNDVIYLNFLTWFAPLQPSEINLTAKSFWFTLSLSFGFVCLVIYLIRNKKQQTNTIEKNDKSTYLQIGVFSLLTIIFGGLPVWITGEKIIEGMWSDRFALAPMWGSILVLLLVIWFFVESKWKRQMIIGFIFAAAIMFQMQKVNEYRNKWIKQQEFFSQIVLRVPSIKEKTAIMMVSLPFSGVAEYSLANALNIIYAENLTSNEVPYYFFSAINRMDQFLGGLVDNYNYVYTIRSIQYIGNTSDTLVFKKLSENSCYVLVEDGDRWLPHLRQDEAKLIGLSNQNRINQIPSFNEQKFLEIFGKLVNDNWCAFFQQADLAAQNENWDQVKKIRSDAENKGYFPNHGRELFPFMRASAYSHDFDTLRNDSRYSLKLSPDIGQRLCYFYTEIENELDLNLNEKEILEKLRSESECSLYN